MSAGGRKNHMIRTVHRNKWIEVRKITNRHKEVKGYYYLHETRCGGRIVALMPFRFGPGNRVEYLLRKEFTPCWSMDDTCMSSITGGVDPGDDDLFTASKELWEEAGFSVGQRSPRFKRLGACFGIKAADTVYDLFAVNVHGLEQQPPPGDGSVLEDMARCVWVSDLLINMAVDPLVYILHYRTARHIRRLARPQAKVNPSKLLTGIHA